MKSPLKIFKLKPEERLQALIALLVIVAFNALFIWRLHDLFMQPGFGPYWKTFEHEYHLSGYDPLTYLGVTGRSYQSTLICHFLRRAMAF